MGRSCWFRKKKALSHIKRKRKKWAGEEAGQNVGMLLYGRNRHSITEKKGKLYGRGSGLCEEKCLGRLLRPPEEDNAYLLTSLH